MAKLIANDVSKMYRRRIHALKHVSFTAEDGDFIVLVGPSGCGKSTLLRVIAGLEKITEGEIFIDSRRINILPPSERNIAMVFQDYALYPHMTVRENLSFGLRIRKTPEKEVEARVQEVSQMLDIGPYLNRKPAELSGGQRQRVAIGRAIVRKPRVFLFDEPLSNLDAQLRAQTRIELAALHNKVGSTSIYVTHDQTEAMTLATRIVVLNKGLVQQIGTPLELYHRPGNRFVAGFIGQPQMNLWEGNLEFLEGRKIFRVFGAEIDLTGVPSPQKPGPYILGIRPEAFSLAKSGIDVEVFFKEEFGHELHLVAKILKKDGEPTPQQAIIRITGDGHSLTRGQRLSVSIDKNRVHWFFADEAAARVDELTT